MNNVLTILILVISASIGADTLNAQWVRQNSGTTAKLTDVTMLDSTTAVVVGYNGVILRTTNAGQTWVMIDSGGGIRWNAVAFGNARNGFAVGDGMAGARTTDGGETWYYWFYSGTINLLSVAYAGENVIFTTDDSGWVRRSLDGGNKWNASRLLDNGPLRCVFFTNAAYDYYTGYAITPWSAFKTTDTGQTWLEEHVPFTRSDVPLRGSFSSSNNQVFIVGYRGIPSSQQPLILQKSAADTSWQVCALPTPLSMPCALQDIDAPGGYVYACGSCGVIATTSMIAATWKYTPYVAGITGSLNAVDFFDKFHGFAVGDSGTILYTANGGVVGIDERGGRTAATFQLKQNYPNPFNPSTVISYELPFNSPVTLKVYDVLGREIKTLVSYRQNAGSHSVTFNAGNLPSGIYFYRLQAETYSETKKLILLK